MTIEINMLRLTQFSVLFVLIYSFNQVTFAGPWFTGPLLAPAAHTLPNGHTNVEVYGIDVFNDGRYGSDGTIGHTPVFKTALINPIITHGFTDWLDMQLSVPYAFDTTRGITDNRLGDVSIAAGLQLLHQNQSPKHIDLRLLIQETLPTGRYEGLNPDELGTDATGLGTYQTQISLNFQYLYEVFNNHFLRTRVVFSRLFSTQVDVTGFNSYGGTSTTSGTVNPGTQNAIDLAVEYTITQNWVAVMEGTVSKGQGTRFKGVVTLEDLDGFSGAIGSGQFNQTALAPAIEYNFSDNVGLISGVWFSLSGVNTAHFITYVLALNAYW